MAKIDDVIYYETGKDSEIEARCGNMDGNLIKGAEQYEIPQRNGKTNFLQICLIMILEQVSLLHKDSKLYIMQKLMVASEN